MTEKTLGRIAFEAYSANRDSKDFAGNPIPAWEAIYPEVRAGWDAAAAAVVLAVRAIEREAKDPLTE